MLLLTCVVDLAIQLLSVVGLEHDLAFDEVLDGALHECVRLLADRAVVDSRWLVVFHEQLLLDVLREERFLVASLGGRGRTLGLQVRVGLRGHHVHLGHMSDDLWVITNLLLLAARIL